MITLLMLKLESNGLPDSEAWSITAEARAKSYGFASERASVITLLMLSVIKMLMLSVITMLVLSMITLLVLS